MTVTRDPAENLRAAADRLDELAAQATERVCSQWVASAVRHISRNCDIVCWHGADRNPEQPDDGRDHDGWSRYDDAPWISLMDPQVAPYLSSWLRASAADVEQREAAGQDSAQSALIDAALAFARAVNGTEVTP